MLVIACISFAIAAGLLSVAEQRLLGHLDGLRGPLWIAEHVALPMGRAACVLLFIAIAYPAIYGLAEAPPLSAVFSVSGRLSAWTNLLFLVALAMPLLPASERLRELILPVQGLLGLAMLAGWVADALGQAEIQLLPSGATLGFAVAWIALNLAAKSWLHRQHWDQGTLWTSDRASELVLLLMQLPVLVVYGAQLGHNFKAATI